MAALQLVDLRASMEAYEAARPTEREALLRATDHWREGKRLAAAGDYEAANESFRQALVVLEEACPDCPGVSMTP